MSHYQPDPPLPQAPEPYQPAARNTLGVVSFAAGLATVLVSMMQSLVQILLVRFAGSGIPYTLVNIAGMSLVGILGAAALVLGIVALLRRGAPKGLAGAGTALGGQAVFFLLLNLVENAVISWR
ncbi:hypothetical protein [Humibacter sp.]|jgi:hypothetical protein|uniref:hypothetical protein n=1 Tax=Humibacter sp. TaxID=1940291 RepID=UPI002C19A849|nr:hypothetical protein [Humibacter sp.]HVX09342.1 hypothetical protein [Humibacter sp.]